MFSLKPIPKNLKNKRVLLRVDLNMPRKDGRFSDDFRFKKILPTIKLLQKKGARIVLASHMEIDGQYHSFKRFENFFPKHIKNFYLSKSVVGGNTHKKTLALNPGDVFMLENLRLESGEKKNSPGFARDLSGLADIYVNEAFSASHRDHASIVGIAEYLPHYAGPLFLEETQNLSRVFSPKRPFVIILGGKKFTTKEPLLEKFIKKADHIFVAGGMAALLLYYRGYKADIGIFDERERERFKKIAEYKKIIGIKDVRIFDAGKRKLIKAENLNGDKIFDIGPETLKEMNDKIKKAKFVLWNGPLGWIEGGFGEGTKGLARILAVSRAETIVGGGDTVAFLRKHKLLKKFSFVSTGGGAMLEFMIKGTLPGIEALLIE